MSRTHRRSLTYAVLGAFFFATYYIYSRPPLDASSVPFAAHEAYMNAPEESLVGLVSQQSYDWRNAPFVNKVKEYIPLPSGEPRELPRVQFDFPPETKAERRIREARRRAVREEFRRTWSAYKEYAWGKDELNPVTATGRDAFGGWGATLVDSLDTLWIMGFRTEFHEAVRAVANIDFGTLSSVGVGSISVFETTIRYLGGLLSAYDLSGEPVLLEKAVQLGEMLYRAFDTTNNTPLTTLNLFEAKSTERKTFPADGYLCFACLGSLTMEFTRLAQITSEPKYYDAVARVSLLLERTQNKTMIPGIWPIMVDAASEIFNSSRSFTIGAMADSSYEYLPKMHALLGGLEPSYGKMFKAAARVIDKHMLYRPMVPDSISGEDLLFCGDAYASGDDAIVLDTEMQHLTCFIGGMFALGGRLLSDAHHVSLGEKLTKGCIHAYTMTPTGIMPETFIATPCAARDHCPWNRTHWEGLVMRQYSSKTVSSIEDAVAQYKIPEGVHQLRDSRYLLRPEAIESVFILYRVTGERAYMDHAWDMFRAIVSASRTPIANGQVLDVFFDASSFSPQNAPKPPPLAPGVRISGGLPHSRDENVEDKMESFWTAETLKYFYLVFERPDMMSLDHWVFNTEAHPFRRPRSGRGREGELRERRRVERKESGW